MGVFRAAVDMRFAYADPPYLGCCRLYKHHHPDGLCWDDIETHRALIDRLNADHDGWALSLTVRSLPTIMRLCPEDVLTLAWVKTSGAPPMGDGRMYSWEPVILRGGRNPSIPTRISHVGGVPLFGFKPAPDSHVIGEKPSYFCDWLFRCAGLTPEDEFTDLFSGSGAVAKAWAAFAAQGRLVG